MNCKPGDVCRYIGKVDEARGMIFMVLKADPYYAGAWIVSPSFPVHLALGGNPESIYDFSLRPIRDPGDDAVDEILQLVGAPSKEGVTA